MSNAVWHSPNLDGTLRKTTLGKTSQLKGMRYYKSLAVVVNLTSLVKFIFEYRPQASWCIKAKAFFEMLLKFDGFLERSNFCDPKKYLNPRTANAKNIT